MFRESRHECVCRCALVTDRDRESGCLVCNGSKKDPTSHRCTSGRTSIRTRVVRVTMQHWLMEARPWELFCFFALIVAPMTQCEVAGSVCLRKCRWDTLIRESPTSVATENPTISQRMQHQMPKERGMQHAESSSCRRVSRVGSASHVLRWPVAPKIRTGCCRTSALPHLPRPFDQL